MTPSLSKVNSSLFACSEILVGDVSKVFADAKLEQKGVKTRAKDRVHVNTGNFLIIILSYQFIKIFPRLLF